MKHTLRALGQTRACCVPNFYKSNGKIVQEKIIISSKSKASRIDLLKLDSMQLCIPIKKDDTEFRKWLGTEDRFIWEEYTLEEGNYNITDFEPNLFYPHCDYREQHNYQGIGKTATSGLLTDNQYLQAGIDVLTATTASRKKTAINKNFNQYGAWVYAHLMYSDYRLHAHYGGMHGLSGVIKWIINTISKSRSPPMSRNMKSYFSKRNMHYYCTGVEKEEYRP